jgi:predicted transcriptional regulator
MALKEEGGANSTVGDGEVLRLTTDIVASFVANNKVAPEQLADLIRTVHQTVTGLAEAAAEVAPERPKPATSINKSVQRDYIVCLEDGKRLKMLKRHLRSTYNMTPDEYRRRWGLPADYPMVAPAYAARRSEFAKQIGLGKAARKKPA